MKVLVCGGLDFRDWGLMNDVLCNLPDWSNLVIVHGAARGADLMAEDWARENGVRYRGYPAQWSKHFKAAGAIRNQQMLDEERPDLVIAFPGDTGTADMVKRAKEAGVRVEPISLTESKVGR